MSTSFTTGAVTETPKASPAADDILLIEDSEDSSRGKFVKVGDLAGANSVASFGADKTGATDSSSAFIAAATAADEASGNNGGRVYVPAGDYIVEGLPLEISGRPILWIGEGIESTTLSSPSTGTDSMFKTTTTGALVGGGVSGFTLLGDATREVPASTDFQDYVAFDGTQTAIDLSSAASANQFYMEHLYVKYFNAAYEGSQNDRNPMFMDVTAWYNDIGFLISSNHPVFAGGTEIRYCRYAIDVASGGQFYDAHLFGVKINYCHYGIYGNSGGTVRNLFWNGGSCVDNLYIGLQVNGSVTGSQVSKISNVQFAKGSSRTNDSAIVVKGDDISITECSFATFDTSSNTGWENGAIVLEIDGTGSTRRINISGNHVKGMDTPFVVHTNANRQLENCKFDNNILSNNVAMSGSWNACFVECLDGGNWYYNSFRNNTIGGDSGTPGNDVIYHPDAAGVNYNNCSGNTVRYSPTVTTGFLWNALNTNNTLVGNIQRRGEDYYDSTRGTLGEDTGNNHYS